MKNLVYFLMIIVLVITSTAQAQKKEERDMKDLLLNKDLKVEKLVIKNEDITYTLGVINVTEKTWVEFDRNGKEIGKANIEKFTNDEIRIKWIFANNGADVGDVTTYRYEKNGDKMVFNVLFDDKEQGFFEATL